MSLSTMPALMANSKILQSNPEENCRNVLDVSVMGIFFELKYALQVMKGQKSGAVVNTTSNGGLLDAPGMSAYVASKHA